MLSPFAQLLRQRTAATHARVEDGLALLDPALTPARLRTVLERFYGFWSATEPAVDRWALANPDLASSLDWPRRRRTGALHADLVRLGTSDGEVSALPSAPAVFGGAGAVGTAEVLGWLYVSEGSTLGGAVITRYLTTRGTLDDAAPLCTFTPYAEGPAPMWRSYLTCAGEYVGDDPTRADAVVHAAGTTFDALATWLAPLLTEAAA